MLIEITVGVYINPDHVLYAGAAMSEDDSQEYKIVMSTGLEIAVEESVWPHVLAQLCSKPRE